MRNALTVLVAIAGAAIGLLLVPAVPAHAAGSAVVTIGQLEAQGFDVKVDRVGSAPLDECEVTGIRNPREQTKLVRVDDDRLIPIVVDRSITVSLDCSR